MILQQAVKMKNKKTSVYEKIKEGIIDGALAPGLPINEKGAMSIITPFSDN